MVEIYTKVSFMTDLIKRITGYDSSKPLASSYITNETNRKPVELGELEKTTLQQRGAADQVESDGKTSIKLVTTHQVVGLTVKDTVQVNLQTGQVTDQRICQYPQNATPEYKKSVQFTYQSLCGNTSFRILGYFKPKVLDQLKCDLSKVLPSEIKGLNGEKREINPQVCYQRTLSFQKR